MKNKVRSQGILLITALITVAFVVMFLSVVVSDIRTGLYFSGNYSYEKRAYWGALAGLSYAESMIQLNGTWRSHSTTIPINYSGVYVEEGYLGGGARQIDATHGVMNGGESEFYIAFATVDSGGKIVPLKDKEGNNLNLYSHNRIYLKDASAELPINLQGLKRTIPPCSLYIGVEGRSGRSRCFIEALYAVTSIDLMPSAAISSGSMDVGLFSTGSKLVVGHAAANNATIRSNDSIRVGNGTDAKDIFDIGEGKAYAKRNITINSTQLNSSNQEDFKISMQTGVDSKNTFPKLTWDEIINKYGDPGNTASTYDARIQGGVYAFLENKSSGDNAGKYTLHHYSSDFDDSFLPSDRGASKFKDNKESLVSGNGVSVLNDGENIGAADLKISITAPTAVGGSGPSTFAAAAYDWDSVLNQYTVSQKARVKVNLEQSSNPDRPASICTNGGLAIKGELSGTGSVVAGSQVDFEAKSVLQPDPQKGLAIYSKGNINLHKISATEALDDPSTYLREAFNNIGTEHGHGGHGGHGGDTEDTGFTSIDRATDELLETHVTYGSQSIRLEDLLRSNFSFTKENAESLATKLITQNSTKELGHSTYDQSQHRFRYYLKKPDDPTWQDVTFSDSIIKGVIYTWKDFNADMVGGSLTIQGALVAYGGNPLTQEPGEDSGYGKVTIRGGDCINIIYDPNYVGLLTDRSYMVKIKRTMLSRL
ncbi:MAG: hypothetical protein RDV48_25960 [Candidatus Eremiobacteraeota bacterium]|nr:hypothetical protein [Candidatus Eremiobacteraeota bacterium]